MKGFASACRALLCCLFRVILARHAVGAMTAGLPSNGRPIAAGRIGEEGHFWTCLQPSLMGESHLHLKIETNSMYDAFSARGPQGLVVHDVATDC